MPQLEVYCTVRNCHYWADGEHCTAEKILVTTDAIGRLYPESVDAAEAQDIVRQHGPTEAEKCYDTCCKTFTPRDGAKPAGTPAKMAGKAQRLATRH